MQKNIFHIQKMFDCIFTELNPKKIRLIILKLVLNYKWHLEYNFIKRKILIKRETN